MSILNLMLAQAINLQDRSGAAQIRETLRCISLLDQVCNSLCSLSSIIFKYLSLRKSW